MKQIDMIFHKSKIGDLVIGSFDGKVCLLDFRYRKMRQAVDKRIKQSLGAEIVETKNSLLQQVTREVDQYLAGNRRRFDFPILMVGSEFQRSVWSALMQIEYGQTCTYAQLAQAIGTPSAARAVAAANGANAIAIMIPCHRVIGSNGELIGYGGGLPVKKKLLNLESAQSQLSLAIQPPVESEQ